MKLKESFQNLSKFELILWILSVLMVTLSYLLSPSEDYLNLIASLIGVTALIFVAKGYVIGQILTVIFALFYGVISYYFRYYGEMITYLGMTAPIAVLTVVQWIRHPYGHTAEVEVRKLTRQQVSRLILLTYFVTILFYFILDALNTNHLFFSTVSVATSFLASSLTFMRSSYYALAYAANDIVLIILWTLATVADISYLPMIICFVMFLINDLYGFWNWQNMQTRQNTSN